LKVSLPERRFRPWREDEEALLGTMDDPKLARKLNRSLVAIKVKRIRRGIASFNFKTAV
jgi:hypothetical protein